MATLVDEAIKRCRAEQLKVAQTIRDYKDILRSMKSRVKGSSEAEPPTSLKHSDIPVKERQEVELLEQVLKKALKIRSSSAVDLNYHEKTPSSDSASKASADKDGDYRNSQKSSFLSSGVKGSRAVQYKSTSGRGDVAARQGRVKTGGLSQPTTKGKQSDRKPFSTQKTTRANAQIKPCQINNCALESERGMPSISLSSEERMSRSAQELKTQSETSAPEEQWVSSPVLPLWQTQRARKNKLWNKVLTRYPKSVPERDNFKKRLISTFPIEWSSVHIAAMEAELDVLTQRGLDLTHCYNAELKSHQLGWRPEPSTEKEYESLLLLTGLEKMMVQVIKKADRLKKDWERKMAWWHGALCPLHSRVDWCDMVQPSLPPILAYSSTGELEDLHSLRLIVDQLKLEIHILQAMCDTLTDLISCQSFSSGCLSPTVLRGVYSLLGEGGAHFPSLVLDTDSTQT